MTLHSTFRLLLLLTAVLVAVGSKNEAGSLETSSDLSRSTRITNNTINVTGTRENDSSKVRATDVREAKEASQNEENDEEDEDEDEDEDDVDGDENETNDNDDGDAVDEYEDELRGIAESHEAMSRDERKNGISSTTTSSLVSENRRVGFETLAGTRNFDSREKSDEIMSDESLVSNEAIPKDDEEVAELLRYKQKSRIGGKNSVVEEFVKNVKRVPTVKKELSTQKEIITTNETHLSLPKTIVRSVEIVNRLDEDVKEDTRFPTSRNHDRYELVREDPSLENDEYTELENSGDALRKLDKRQSYDKLNGLRSYFLDGYNSERERRRKLRELGIEEGALAESLMGLLARLAENPRLWEKVHRILEDVEGLSMSREIPLDSQKRGYSSDSMLQIPMTEYTTVSPENLATTKKPKKKKKKKRRRRKKPRDRSVSLTSTNQPATSQTILPSSPAMPFLTTEASTVWHPTTQPQWRLVAERLFGSPWSHDDNNRSRLKSTGTTKVRELNDRLGSIDEKQRVEALNDERQALMRQSAREYSQPRRLHYGKVNTHEKSSAGTSHEAAPKNYDSKMENRVLDYDTSEERSYQQRPISLDPYDHYGHYGRQRIRDFGPNTDERNIGNDYDDMYQNRDPPTTTFARSQQFRPLGREYASTKIWQDSRYDYGRPWKDKNRPIVDETPNANWPWRAAPSDYKIWIPRYRSWPRDRNYWQPFGNSADRTDDIVDDELNDEPQTRNWQSKQQQDWPTYSDDSAGWNIVNVPSWRLNGPKSNLRESLSSNVEKNKNRSDLGTSKIENSANPIVKEKPLLPKITMKTWNSLTSDPATWPFKLTGAKPWPKDKNGISYNPNAELVRKLGLDKQDRLLSAGKSEDVAIGKENVPQEPNSKYKITANANREMGRNDLGGMTNSAKNSLTWPEKLNGINEWRGKSADGSPQRAEIWHRRLENSEKIWQEKAPVSPKISAVGAWVMPVDQSTWRPYDIKHTAYGKLSDGRIDRWNEPRSPVDGSSWQSKSDAVSSVWPQKINDWNVVEPVFTADKSAPNGHASTWPSKWRQFAYHKVTAAPIAKTGLSGVIDNANRPRNSYIAVSAVSPVKYPNNEWRKNEIEETQLDRNLGADDASHGIGYDQDEPSSQLLKNHGSTNERWNKEKQRKGNDPLEHQLEELRQPYWNHKQLHEHSQLQKRSNASEISSVFVATTQKSQIRRNSSLVENASLKNHDKSKKVTETSTQVKNNATK